MHNEIGVIARLRPGEPALKYVRDFGLKVCQVFVAPQEAQDLALADTLRRESVESGVRITSIWAGVPGKQVWNFMEGPSTLGLVPRDTRAERVASLKNAGRFAKQLGVPAIVTHLGFIPENPRDPLFEEVVIAVREVAVAVKDMGVEFWFETGQETPITMRRLIECVATNNLGINLDPANLILYGKGNPVDALDVFGEHVKSIHAKDGMYPTDPSKLGKEVKVGEGRVRFPLFVKALRDIGYSGAYIIEREIKGDQQGKDIADTVAYLRKLVEDVNA